MFNLSIKKVIFFKILFITFFNGYAQDSLQYVIAQKGDGILSLLRKQGVNPYDVYDEFISLNIENLRDRCSLLFDFWARWS